MSDCRSQYIVLRIENNGNKFYTHIEKVLFDGYKKIYKHYEEETLNEGKKSYKEGEVLHAISVEAKEKETQPPPRFNQASLIKVLEEEGVGRPSTYASMATKALQSGYAHLDKRAFVMNETGNNVIESLQDFFPEIIQPSFTKEMEEHLDEITHEDES
jgi:DNA topoisomerase-1